MLYDRALKQTLAFFSRSYLQLVEIDYSEALHVKNVEIVANGVTKKVQEICARHFMVIEQVNPEVNVQSMTLLTLATTLVKDPRNENFNYTFYTFDSQAFPDVTLYKEIGNVSITQEKGEIIVGMAAKHK